MGFAHLCKQAKLLPRFSDKRKVDEIVKEFLQESTENLDSLDQQFVRLEANPEDREMLGAIFRTIHTIKGTTGFLGFQHLEALTHAGENLLSRLREGELVLTSEMTSALLRMVDAVRRMLTEIEATEADGIEDETELIAVLNAHAQGIGIPVAPAALMVEAKQNDTEAAPNRHPGPALLAAEQSATPAPAPVPSSTPPPTPTREQKTVAESSVRVDVALLDQLMDLMGELVLARNQIVQFAAISQEAAFLPLSQRLNLITTEMRERVTKTRMQPIEQLFNKLPRMVREIALSCGKKVNLEVAGSETEIDRSILDAIKDPMTHAVRNAVDHGIERPEVRVGKGKPEYGTVRISAEHDSGYVVLKIKDDGAGLNPNALGNKAVERGLITREAVDKLNEAEVRDLIFLPGFSTASQVSNISGRGVGMDVVRTNVEKTGGTVELDSEFGSGTTLRFRIPLTLAIIPALMVECNGQAFALPQMSLVELVRIPQSEQDCVESIGDALVYRLRGRLLPLIVLSDLLSGVPSQPPSIGQEIVAIVLRFGSRHFGLIVEKVEDAEEIVVKPLGQLLSEVPLFSGATVRGDGKIALILDVNAIATSSRAFEKQHQGDLCEAPQEQIARRTRQLLYVDAGGRAAIEISHISRIEQLSPSQIESLHGKPVFQYQGRILPLIDLRSSDNDLRSSKNDLQSSDNPSTPVPVLVCEHNGQSAGVAVERVLDSAEEEITFDPESGDAVILQGAITHLLDMNALIENHCGGSQ